MITLLFGTVLAVGALAYVLYPLFFGAPASPGSSAAVSSPARETDDAIEAAVAAFRKRQRECATCGPRPETDAVYCSNCGTYLPGLCGHCGAAVAEQNARFCASCGRSLATT